MARSLSINDAARQLGLSPDTVRRRIRIGVLAAHQKPRGRGYQWIVDLPDAQPGTDAAGEPNADMGHAPTIEEYQQMKQQVIDLRRMLEVATAELEARRSETGRLLALLEQAQGR
jgi:hypothetical protein